MTKKRFINSFIIILSFFGLLYIMWAVPFTRDDWAWGASVGAQRLSSHFADYNGRYLGNLLIILLTKSRMIKALGMAVISFFIPYLTYKYICNTQIFYFIFSLILLFVMPANVFRQTMGWASGAANYIPPIALTLLYLVMVRNIFNKKVPEYNKWLPAAAFSVGVCGNLFMEHVTILNLALSAAVILYSYVRFKKFFAVHIANLAGNIIGAVIMFSNSAYRIIAGGNDFYRSIPNENGLLSQIIKNSKIIYARSFESNAVLNLILTVMLIFLVKDCIDGKKSGSSKKGFLISILTVNCIYTVFCIIKNFIGISGRIINTPVFSTIRGIFAVLFIANLIVVPFICISNKNRAVKITFPVFCSVILCVPLLAVSPVTGRCFLPVYVMLMVYACELILYLFENCGIIVKGRQILNCVLLISLCIITVFYSFTFTKISKFESERTSYVQQQIKNGNQTVYIPEYPKSIIGFTEGTKPESKMWQTRYKDFHNIDQNINLVPITYNEYERQKNKR